LDSVPPATPGVTEVEPAPQVFHSDKFVLVSPASPEITEVEPAPQVSKICLLANKIKNGFYFSQSKQV
jgi:hypothetical protein